MYIMNWLKPESDREANYYRLLAILKKIENIVKNDINLALKYLKYLMIEIELAYLKYFDDYEYLQQLKINKYVITSYYIKLKEL